MSDAVVHFTKLAATFVRGRHAQGDEVELPRPLLEKPVDALSAEELETIFRHGVRAGLKLHQFKRTMGLPRVRRVFGVLMGLVPENLLDVGSGRGAFLWPLLDSFPNLPVTAIDRDPRRAADVLAVRAGGCARLRGCRMDVTRMAFAADSFDVVTMLEVLEHVAEFQAALREVVRVARRCVILSVPSKADSNPQHVHLFTQEDLAEGFARAGAERVGFDYVPGHLIAVARVSSR